jgi:hypothetical protein
MDQRTAINPTASTTAAAKKTLSSATCEQTEMIRVRIKRFSEADPP